MDLIDNRFSSLGLLTFQFEVKFKKVLLFLETMDDPELLFNITCFLDIHDLLSLLSVCKKLNELQRIPIIEVRILKEKIRILQSPKQALNSLSLLPAYYQFLLHQKQEEKEIPKNVELLFKNFKQYKKGMEAMRKKKELMLKKDLTVNKLLEGEKAYEGKVSGIEKEISRGQNIYQSIQLATKPEKVSQKPKSYVQKFREEYVKIKEFEERKNNIKELETLHKKESQKVRIKRQIETPLRTIPIIQIQEDETISVINVDSFYRTTASRFLNRVKTIMGIKIYY